MDPVIATLVTFLILNLMLVTAMLRRIDLNNESVIAWEREQVLADAAATALSPEVEPVTGN
ncbi:hypothetical protein QWY20_04825 [Alkalimonas sp. MEB108]|uniref:Biopolymer transporter ExbD n=1 Tax=Alkalimonas cellulosilytica TaxID=3058395 RepID=A0ABU7J322_9GAMM|nr:hypothetical protein [Alkalimonas sp. MEB108]MEE2000767.1 hypothetical protein [Alkalimonas sp. MEB108]